ncbi:hypothetical protein FHS85_004060 [Rhodoligotrophos appendicifer]|uniref:hypothetical protein n=1 Tax=Rhodoligotrophos appendicifer TaxID=987056 RepID=UPI0011869736|nr:hypothetical protein [Rhodoligotrophos appendicifer]
MEIRVSPALAVTLVAPDDLKRFKTVVEFGSDRLEDLKTALKTAGEVESKDAVWISADWLKSESGLADNSEWASGFEGMLSYAAKHGWVRDGSPVMIRSHVEWPNEATAA